MCFAEWDAHFVSGWPVDARSDAVRSHSSAETLLHRYQKRQHETPPKETLKTVCNHDKTALRPLFMESGCQFKEVEILSPLWRRKIQEKLKLHFSVQRKTTLRGLAHIVEACTWLYDF